MQRTRTFDELVAGQDRDAFSLSNLVVYSAIGVLLLAFWLSVALFVL